MKKISLLFSALVFIGCEKNTEKHLSSNEPLVEVKKHIKNDASRTYRKNARDYELMLEEKSHNLLSETGPPNYLATMKEIWSLGETGLIDYSNNPEYLEMTKSANLAYRLKHHPNFIFEAKVFNLIRDAKKESPAVRFRIGYLVLLRLASQPKEGISLKETTWKNTGPPSATVESALALMSEAYGENLEQRGAFSSELFELAEKWIAENPLP